MMWRVSVLHLYSFVSYRQVHMNSLTPHRCYFHGGRSFITGDVHVIYRSLC
jgi:hypothetical protein